VGPGVVRRGPRFPHTAPHRATGTHTPPPDEVSEEPDVPEALKLQELEKLNSQLVQCPSFHCGQGSAQAGTRAPPVSTKAALAQARAPVSQYQFGLPLTLCPRTMHFTWTWLPGASVPATGEWVVGACRRDRSVRETTMPGVEPLWP
jgi:hypothetical protein